MKSITLADVALALAVGLGVTWAVRKAPVVGSLAGGLVPVAAGSTAVYLLAMHRPANGFQLPKLVGA